MHTEDSCTLESVIVTDLLDQRTARAPEPAREMRATLELLRDLAETPHDFFSRLVTVALEISGADSTGISLLDEEERKFVWPAVAGKLTSYIGGGTPRDFGPCGTVLDRDAPILFSHPERHFTYLKPITPPLEEVLLIPFHMDGKPVGTIWAVIHEPDRRFDAEDRRLLESLSNFAASAYRALTKAGSLDAMLGRRPAAECDHAA